MLFSSYHCVQQGAQAFVFLKLNVCVSQGASPPATTEEPTFVPVEKEAYAVAKRLTQEAAMSCPVLKVCIATYIHRCT